MGPLLGGAAYDFLQDNPLTWLPPVAPLQVLIVVAITFAILAQLTLARMRTPNTTTDSVRSLLSTLLSTETFQALTGNVLFWRRPPKE